MLLKFFRQGKRIHLFEFKEDDVRFHIFGIEFDPWNFCQTKGQGLSIFMVLGKAVPVMIQGIMRCSARTPDCRIAPPKSLRKRLLSRMNSFEPANAEPTGAPRPLEKQTETESNPFRISASDVLEATAAFQSRAPSI